MVCKQKINAVNINKVVTMMMMIVLCLGLNISYILFHLSFAIIHWGRIISPTLEMRNWVSEVNGLPKSLKYVSDSLDCRPSLYIIVMLTYLFLERVVFSRLDHWCPKHYLPTVASLSLTFMMGVLWDAINLHLEWFFWPFSVISLNYKQVPNVDCKNLIGRWRRHSN